MIYIGKTFSFPIKKQTKTYSLIGYNHLRLALGLLSKISLEKINIKYIKDFFYSLLATAQPLPPLSIIHF